MSAKETVLDDMTLGGLRGTPSAGTAGAETRATDLGVAPGVATVYPLFMASPDRALIPKRISASAVLSSIEMMRSFGTMSLSSRSMLIISLSPLPQADADSLTSALIRGAGWGVDLGFPRG